MAKGKYEEWLEPDNLLRLEAWARNGLTDEQIAKNMGISTASLYNYKNNHVEILEALKRGKEVIDIQVENALLKRALGYECNEITYERIENTIVEPNGAIRMEPGTRIKTVIKQVAPDVTAQIFWLKNRKPLEWRDKQQLEHSGSISSEVVIEIGVDELGD